MRFFSQKRYILLILSLLNRLIVFSQSSFCNNLDFEQTGTLSPGPINTNAVAGWTIHSSIGRTSPSTFSWSPGSNGVSISTTPLFNQSIIGTIPHSPLGGTRVARLGSNLSANASKISSTFWVPTSNPYFYYAFAGFWAASFESCWEGPGFEIIIKNASGVIQTCLSNTFSPAPACQNGHNFTVTPGYFWTNWKTRTLDLSAFAGSSVTIEVINTGCTFVGGHHGTLYFDAICPGSCCNQSPFVNTVAFCAGSNIATLNAPPGYQTYQWISPSSGAIAAPQGTMSVITISNPIIGTTYTAQLTNPLGCQYIYTVMIVNSTVSIIGLGASPSCSLGASGSASVIGGGSSSGYNYLWSSSSNTSVGTSSTVSNLSPGIYSVQVTAINAPSCGLAMTTITVNASPPVLNIINQPYCGNTAYLSTNGGTNHQWYNGTVAIASGAGGTASSYNVNSATNGSVYRLSYLSPQGCQDSVQFTLYSVTPGNMEISYPNMICQGANNGQAVVSLTPVVPAPFGNNYFIVNSVSLTPIYVSSISPTSSNSFSLTGLSAGGIYSVQVFDGACKYSTTFSPNTLPAYNYTLSPQNLTLCPGNLVAAGVTFPSVPSLGQYSYSWSPNVFLAGNNSTLMSTIIQPTASNGNSATVIYTVVVTPSVANCPLTKTLALSIINPPTPTISPLNQIICANNGTVQLNANPSGGTYFSNSSFSLSPITGSNGVLNPNIAQHGLNTFTYSIQQHTCVASSIGTYTVSKPQNMVSGNLYACVGESFTLQVHGANSYSWSNGSIDSMVVIALPASNNITVTASNTLGNCSNQSVLSLSVVPLPIVSINGKANACNGETFSLTALGANTYTWNNGSTNAILNFTANQSSNYSVTGSSAYGCKNSASLSVQVNPNPTVYTSGDVTACNGDWIKLKAFGANTYIWSNGMQSDSIYVRPQKDSIFKVTGFTNVNCKNQSSLNVKVNPLPNLKLIARDKICIGDFDTLIASGAYRYEWENGLTDSIRIINLNSTQNFNITGLSKFNCALSIPFTVEALMSPEIKISGKTKLCEGEQTTLTASGANEYYWTTGSTSSSITVAPKIEQYFSVLGTNDNNCSTEKLILISVSNCDTINSGLQLNVYPNPSSGQFFISSDLPIKTEIYFSLGQLLQKNNFENGVHLLELSAYSDGIYILRVNYNSETRIFKLIKYDKK